MSNTNKHAILPLEANGVQHILERVYREGGTFQWVRETLFNGREAGADRILFGVEWQAVESQDVYRRTIADNGSGMLPDDLQAFFRSFGGGGKPIGGVHQNYGVGSKTSLLPWNRYGLVVVSWVDGQGAMIWIKRDQKTGEYGLRVFEVENPETGELELSGVCAPFNDPEHGCDWSKVGPEWARPHGTVVVLLGDSVREDTLKGDPGREEEDIKGLSSYLNRRIWNLEDGVRIEVEEMMSSKRDKWPRNRSEAKERGKSDEATTSGGMTRTIVGALACIECSDSKKGRVSDCGTVDLPDGTEIDWFLWDGERPKIHSYAAMNGYVATLYRNELYDVTHHSSSFRSFGITDGSVKKRVWLIVRPPEFDVSTGRRGIYPRTDRNGLLIQGGYGAGDVLPIADWAAEFCDRMPPAILEALAQARVGTNGTMQDKEWRKRLGERFGALWKIPRLRVQKGGPEVVDPTQEGSIPKVRVKLEPKPPKPPVPGVRREPRTRVDTGVDKGLQAAVQRKVAGGLPHYEWVRADSFDHPGHLANWQAKHPEHLEGVVNLNVDHPVITAEVQRWQAQYAPHKADEVRDIVLAVYGEYAVSKVAHSESMKSLLPKETVEKELRSESALTMALLGIFGAEANISNRIKALPKRRRVS